MLNQYKNNYRKLLSITLLVLICCVVKAQTTNNYTQYMDNPVPINPAYSLTNNYGSVNFTARKQWLGIQGAPAEFTFNTDFPLLINNAKGGFIASDNSSGVEHVSELNAFFAKSVRLNETESLGIAINGGLKYYTTAYAQLDPHDPAIQNDVKQFSPNVGISAIFYGDDFYLGVSAPEITFHSQDNTLLDNNNFRNHYYFSGGLTSILDEDFKLKPAALVYYSRGVPITVDLSTKLLIKNTLGFGINFRNTKELAALFSIDQESFHFGYSYQFGISDSSVGQFYNATHEITLAFFFGKGNQVPINPGSK